MFTLNSVWSGDIKVVVSICYTLGYGCVGRAEDSTRAALRVHEFDGSKTFLLVLSQTCERSNFGP